MYFQILSFSVALSLGVGSGSPPESTDAAVHTAALRSIVAISPADAPEIPPSHPTAEAAFSALAKHVKRQSHPEALRRALQAYYGYKAAHPKSVRNPYFYFVDYGLDNRTPRGYVFDMETLKLLEGPFMVAHGRGSAGSGGVPTRFSNVKDTNASSLGLYVAEETYTFRGRSAGRRYQSIGLRLRGVSGRFNSAARVRGIVVHGAPYVTSERAGRSEGCPAMEESRAQRLIPKIRNGGLVFLFSPRDPAWLRDDPWAKMSGGSTASR